MKKALCFLFALILALSASGCQFKATPKESPTTSTTSARINARELFANLSDDANVAAYSACSGPARSVPARSNISYDQMSFDKFNKDRFEYYADQVTKLAEDSYSDANSKLLLMAYDKMSYEYDKYQDWLTKLMTDYYQAPTDESARTAFNTANEESLDISDTITDAVTAIVSSEYSDALIAHTGCSRLSTLDDMSTFDSVNDMYSQELALEQQYNDYYTGTNEITADYGGTTWTWSLFYDSGDSLSNDDYYAVYDALVAADNQAMGQVLIDLVSVRNKIAFYYGYDNYYDMSWSETYYRDYTYDTFLTMCDYFKNYLSGLSLDLESQAAYYDAFDTTDFYSRLAGQSLSPVTLDAVNFVNSNGLVIYGDSSSYNSSFSSKYFSYNEPMIFTHSDGTLMDVLALAHETGHATNYYYSTATSYYLDTFSSVDLAETQSNGFSLIYAGQVASLYPDRYDEVYNATISNVLSSTLYQALFSEIEQMLYTTPGITLDTANYNAGQLAAEYGLDYPDGYLGWAEIPHLSSSPGYVASYATSAAAAFALWDESLTDYDAALAKYDQLTGMSCCANNFMSAMDELGLTEILDESFYSTLRNDIIAATGIE